MEEEYDDYDFYEEQYDLLNERHEHLIEKILQHISIIETNTDNNIVLAKCNQIREEINNDIKSDVE